VRSILARLAALAGIAAVGAYLRGPSGRARSPEGQRELERAVARVDRELAADLELMSLFDQTKQPFVLENGEFLAAAAALEREAPDAFVFVRDVYERIPATEAAMERRGPAGSIADADRILIHAWEGDAREAQRVLRASLSVDRAPRWRALVARLRARFTAH
jgi:hypothetical protein